jgi:hypothetical protein
MAEDTSSGSPIALGRFAPSCSVETTDSGGVLAHLDYIRGVGLGVGVGVGVGRVVAGMPLPGTQGWATVLVVTAVPGLLRLVLPITLLAPPTVAPTAGMPVAGLVTPAVEVVAVVVAVPGRAPHGPATVLMVDAVLLLVAGGRTPTGLEVTAGVPPALPGAATVFWLGVVVGL